VRFRYWQQQQAELGLGGQAGADRHSGDNIQRCKERTWLGGQPERLFDSIPILNVTYALENGFSRNENAAEQVQIAHGELLVAKGVILEEASAYDPKSLKG